MPRDGSGVYTLPAGNPVVTNTVIASTWANGTMSDIAAQLNNVFTRDGTLGPTGPFKLMDGTIAAPGLAWNSEPGLGLFRPTASLIGFVAQGAYLAYLSGNTATTTFVLSPKAAAGASQFTVTNAPNGAANLNSLNISASSTSLTIGTSKAGAAGALGLILSNPDANIYLRSGTTEISGPNGTGNAQIILNKGVSGQTSIVYGMKSGLQRWNLQLGNAATESGANSGSDFEISRSDDSGAYLGSPFSISRSNGNVNIVNQLFVGGALGVNGGLTVNTGSLAVSAGNITASGTATAAAFSMPGGMPIWNQDATNIYFQFAANWFLQYIKSTGQLNWNRNGLPSTVFAANGEFYSGSNLYVGTDNSFGLIVSDPALKYLRFSSDNWRLQYIVANGNLSYVNFAGTTLWTLDGVGNMTVVGNLAGSKIIDAIGGLRSRQGANGAVGGNVYNWFWNTDNRPYLFVDTANQGWVTLTPVSDERVKENIVDLQPDDAAYLSLRTIGFNRIGKDEYQEGFSAQNVAEHLPVALVGDVTKELDPNFPCSVDTAPILVRTVVMVKDLIRRIQQLENP
jgi:hypothetical protein